MSGAAKFHANQKVTIDGRPAYIVDVLSTQWFVEFAIDDYQFIFMGKGHGIKADTGSNRC